MSFFMSVTFLLRFIIVTSLVEKVSCIKNDLYQNWYKNIRKQKVYHLWYVSCM